jgi:hypothetical protein
MAKIYQITPSTGAAMALLRQYRSRSIAAGVIIGEYLCRLYGTTHSRAITDEMGKRGLIQAGVPGFWVGAVLRDPRFTNTGRVVLPPLAPGAASHDPRLIWLWRLKSGGVGPLILYEYNEYRGQRPSPTQNQKVLFILRHVTITKDGKRWYGASVWRYDEYAETIKRHSSTYHDWVLLFVRLKNMQATSRAQARAEAKRLVTAFVETH